MFAAWNETELSWSRICAPDISHRRDQSGVTPPKRLAALALPSAGRFPPESTRKADVKLKREFYDESAKEHARRLPTAPDPIREHRVHDETAKEPIED